MSFAQLSVALMGLVWAPVALAKPVVTVSIGVPQVVIAPAPVVVVGPRCPGPNSVWVNGSWRTDVYGRPLWVGGHCAMRQVVIQRVIAPPPPRTVIVHRY